jgi:hypothetical protein
MGVGDNWWAMMPIMATNKDDKKGKRKQRREKRIWMYTGCE